MICRERQVAIMPRPKKFPDYNADKIQKELIKAVVESYEETGELKITANEFSLSPLKIRKMLILQGYIGMKYQMKLMNYIGREKQYSR